MSEEECKGSQGSGRESPSPPAGEADHELSKNKVRCIVKLLDGEIFRCDIQVRPCRAV